jgi:hypothetical protein
VGAEEDIWNTELQPKQTCIIMTLKIFILRQQYCEDDRTNEGGMDRSKQLALMTRSKNTGVAKPQRIGPTARPTRRVELSINTDTTQIATVGAKRSVGLRTRTRGGRWTGNEPMGGTDCDNYGSHPVVLLNKLY